MLENGGVPGEGGATLPSTTGRRSQGAIAIRWIDLDAADASVATLSVQERARAERLRLPLVRRRFVAGRVAVRRILADELGCAPAAVDLVAGLHGKPAVGGEDIAFNLSHSAGIAVLAVGGQRSLGVDCEVADDDGAAMRRTIDPFLSAQERAIVDAVPRLDAALLFRLWTRKEALAKAMGLGFRFRFDTATLLPEDDGGIVHVPEHGPFRLRGLEARRHVAATLCVAGSAALPPIEYHHHPT